MWNYVSEKTIGVAISHLDGASIPHGLTLQLGDLVEITQICEDWYLGVNLRTPSLQGIFPCSYVQVRPTSDQERCWHYDDPVVEEATNVLREWGVIWNRSFVRRQREQCTMLRSAILDLMDWRLQLMTGTFTLDHLRDLRLRITSHIDSGNRKLGLDLVPRIDERIVGPDTLGVYQLYNVHVTSAEKNRSATWNSTLPARGGKNAESRPATHHLYLSMRHFGCSLGEDAEVYFVLYDMQHSRYVSEKFLVKVLKEGFSSYIGKANNSATLFTELGSADLKKDLYLVVQVVRLGRLLYTESSKKPLNQTYRRPHAVAVLPLAELLADANGLGAEDEEEREYPLKLYQSDEKDYGLWQHELVAKKSTSKFSLLSGQVSQGVVVSLRLLRGELAALRHEYIHLLKNIALTQKLGFPDVIMPGDVRNDLYFVIERGEFERGGKSSSKNVEVTVQVLDEFGRPIQNCLYGASNVDGVTQHHSVVLYHMNGPVWYEMIKVLLSIEKYYGAHLRLEYRHCSTKDKTEKRLIGFSFIPLMDRDGTVLPDGQHQLLVYKVEDSARLKDPSVSYLQLPYSAKQVQSVAVQATSSIASSSPSCASFQRNGRESVTVAFYLCSTKLTQNANLLSLLKWKSHPERITDTLNLVMRLRGEELVKFLQDVLDSLFVMFSDAEGNATPHSGLVFEVLVNILSLLDDSKFQHFKSVVDAYITDHFSAALAYKGLLSCVQQCTDRVHSSSDCKHEPIQQCFRAFEILFKLVIQSRRLYARAMLENQKEDDFRQFLQSLFATFNKVASLCSDGLVNTQVVLLRNIYTVVEQLSQILSQAEAAKLLSSLIDSLPKEPHPLIATARMQLVLTTVRGPLFTESSAARAILLATICRQLRLHLSQPLVTSFCTETLGHMMNFYRNMSMADDTTEDNVWYRDVETIALATLAVLIQAVQSAQKTDSNVGPLVACLLSVLELLDQGHYDRLWSELSERKPLKDFLLQLFAVLRTLARQGEHVFPFEWSTMHCVVNRVMLSALDQMTQPLVAYFLDCGWFDSQLWSNYFDLAVSFLTQPSLQLEKRTAGQRLKMVRAQGGDMRVQMGFQILTMWNAIGDYKIHFIPSMVGPFLQVTLVPEPTLRRATLPIFFDMLDCEHRHRGNFKQVESELIDKLDVLVGENKGDDNYKELFNTILLEKVKSCDVTWQKHGKAFIGSITRLLERLLDYRNVMEGEENRDKRMSCTFNLLNFYKDEVDRRDMYLRYIYKLHDLHLSADNYTEAALTLQLHASQMGWSSQMMPADGHHSSQMEWQRKEQLYMKSIAYFDRGKCWEKGIPLCKELADFYETRLYDYGKLSHILRMQAGFYDHILTQLRPEPEYFRVGFYGQGFPLFLRNRLFVYRGLEYERIGAFTQRLQTEFPTAHILTKNTPPGDAILTSEGQHIQICNVKPVAEDHPVFDAGLVGFHEKIRSYYRVNDVRRFQLDRPVHKGPVDRDNEFKSLWIERTWLVSEHPLPGILRWFQVVDRHVEEIAPVQYACETVMSVNRELQQLASLHAAEPRRNINPFSMRLQGVIDACVMGGIAKYQEAFFNSDFLVSHPTHLEHVLQLRQCIVEQVRILEAGLTLHGKLAPPEVQPLHKRLVDCLAQMKQRLKEWGFPSPDTGARYANSQTPAALGHHHRRADSDAGIEYSPAKLNSSNALLNASLSMASDRVRAQRSLMAGGGPPSNRSSSSSSSLYGHLTVGEVGSEDEEDLYCKPSEILEKLQAANTAASVPLQPVHSTNSTTPRSAGSVATVSRAKSPRWANEYIFFSPASLRDSGFGTDRDSLASNNPVHSLTITRTPLSSKLPPTSLTQQSRHTHSSPNVHDTVDSTLSRTPPRQIAPPLPPRSSKSSFDESFMGGDSASPPPIHPKRVLKKGQPGIPSSLVMSPEAGESGTMRHHRPPPAPPLPPKSGYTASPMSPTPGTLGPPVTGPPPVPPHGRPAINNSTSFSNPLDLGSGSGSLVDEVCSLLAASGCRMMSNGSNKSPSPPASTPPPLPVLPPPDESLYSVETA